MLVDSLLNLGTRKKYFSLYIALQDLDFSWTREMVHTVLEQWNEGLSLEEISRKINRDEDEISLLIIDLGNYLFFPRNNGIQRSSSLHHFHSEYFQNKEYFFRIKRDYLVFANAGNEFFWKDYEVLTIELLWNAGFSIEDMSGKLKRDIFEILLLIMDRCKKQKIQPRKTGLFGNDRQELCVG